MKLASSSVRAFLFTTVVLVVAVVSPVLQARENPSSGQSEIFASGLADGGRLYIRRSPTLGHNVSISIRIDGKVAGALVRGRSFEKYIKPGRHVLVASPNRLWGDWTGGVEIQRGKTYTYIASYNVDRLRLDYIKPVR